ncbi:MAG: sodium:solute symporter family protein [Oscillospiraceae bacterium]|nr:sodium:solute symporter family protein [Oscillospiraceae bacterium]
MNLVLLIMGLYMIIMLIIGIFFSKRARSTEGYYLSGRSLPTFVLVFTFAATWIGASATLGKSGQAYNIGISAISPTLGTFVAFFIFSFFAGRIRRIGAKYDISSIPDLFLKRFGKSTSVIAAIVIAWTLIGTTGTQLIAFSKVLKYILNPYGISYEQALIIGMIVIVIYTVLSGMYGVAYTDVLQGLILLIVIGVVVPFGALNMAGGWSEVRTQLDPSYFTLKPSATMFGYTITSFLYFVAGPPYWQRAFSAKSNKSASRGAFGGNLLIIYYSFAVILIGICAAVVFPGVSSDESEMLLLLMVEKRFPAVVYAITVAAIVAVIMSTTDSYLILSAQTVATDIYGCLSGTKDSKKLIRISRISVILVGAFAVLFALSRTNIFEAMMLSMTQFAAGVAVPALAALFSKKVTRQGMNAAMLSGLVFSIFWSKVLHSPAGISESIAGSLVSLAVIVVVSALTQKQTEVPFFE